MTKKFIIAFILSSAVCDPGLAFAQDGATAGAITGGVTGAVVGGPVGAAVGAGVGAVAGGVADEATRRNRPDVVVVPDRTGSIPGCTSSTTTTENSFGDTRTVTRERC